MTDHESIDAGRLCRASLSLDRRERAVLVLSAAEGLDIAAVAVRLDLDQAEAERLLASALYKLERALRRDERPWWRFW